MNDNEIRLELAGWLMCMFGVLVLLAAINDFSTPLNDVMTVMARVILCMFCLTAGLFFGANWDKFFSWRD